MPHPPHPVSAALTGEVVGFASWAKPESDSWLILNRNQEQLASCLEQGIANILEQQRNLSKIVLTYIGDVSVVSANSLEPRGKAKVKRKSAKGVVESSDTFRAGKHNGATLDIASSNSPCASDADAGLQSMQNQKEAPAPNNSTAPVPQVAISGAGSLQGKLEAKQILKKMRTANGQKRPTTPKKAFKTQKSQATGVHGMLEDLVHHKAFDTVCAVAIILNSVLIGASVEYGVTHDQEHICIYVSSQVCNTFFFGELALRMWAAGRNFFCNEDFKWNWFDFLLVSLNICDLILLDLLSLNSKSGTTQIGSGLKILKMLRIVRIFRVFRFFKDLSLLALMILDSLRSLMWALLMLTIIIYVFAICFTQGVSDHMKKIRDEGKTNADMDKYFGGLLKTLYSLVQSILNGVSWGIISDTLFNVGFFFSMLFFFYIFFAVLAVLNIITGVFVDNAVETAKTEREFLVQKEMELKERYVQDMRDLFMEMDEDGSGSITRKELEVYCDDARVQAYFTALGLDLSDTDRLFRLIDDGESGEVDVDDFLEGCLRLKGAARSIDVHAVISEVKRLEVTLERFLGASPDRGGTSNSFSASETKLQMLM